MTHSIRVTLFLLSLISVVGAVIHAQDSLIIDEVVITGTRFEIPVEKSGKSIYKITQEDLQRSAGSDIQDVLNQVPGLHFNGNFGTPGTNIQYSSRGGGERQVLILIDGIPISDPSGIEAFYDLRLLSVDQVESIEVLKGGLSTLYGAGASTGVINIQLKKSSEKSVKGSIDLHAGSYGEIGGNIMANGNSGNHTYLASVGIEHVGGFSAASEGLSSAPFGDDGIDKINTLIKYGYQFNDRFGIDIMGMYNDINLEYDDGSFTDADNTQLVDEFRIGITPEYRYDKGSIKLKTSFTDGDRSFQSSFPSQFNTRFFQLDITQQHKISSLITGVWGLQWQKLSYNNGGADHALTAINMLDPYASLILQTQDGFTFHMGTRANSHSDYGTELVFNLNPSYLIKVGRKSQLKLNGSISSSYAAPSLFQLHDPFSGNAELLPERSTNAEFGISYQRDSEFMPILIDKKRTP